MEDVYEYQSIDPRQNSNELGITVYFDTGVKKDEAVTQMALLLDGIGAEYTFDIWSKPMEDEE